MSKQLKSILWKNWLLKVSHPWSTAAEILLPVIFMALLILIKQITSSYDSPNVAYTCGNTVTLFPPSRSRSHYLLQYPWSYYTSLNSENALNESSPVNCLIKPDTCQEQNYYRGGTRVNDVKLYDQYGYVDSGSSSGISANPFYSKF
jgi:hypothetical protein